MATLEDYGKYETAWCPGCGDFGLLQALKKGLVACNLEPHQVLITSGIGQAAKAPHYLNVNVFNGLHGRALPPATGAKLANPNLVVIAESGDGCFYGEGGNHFLGALRRNINITMLVHNNQVYGLTKGQASPTSEEGLVTKAQPHGALSEPFNPVAVAITFFANFVARGFSGNIDQLADLIKQGIEHKGFSLIDVFQPCVSFNKVNTYAWYKKHCYDIPADHDPANWDAAMKLALQNEDKIPLGVLYKNNRPAFEDKFPILSEGPLFSKDVDKAALADILDSFA